MAVRQSFDDHNDRSLSVAVAAAAAGQISILLALDQIQLPLSRL